MGPIAQRVEEDSSLVCEGDSYYKVKKTGVPTCKQCRYTCTEAGYGYNETDQRETNEHGFLNCYSCIRCPTGTYREYSEIPNEPKCRECKLDCLERNRYGSVECGGATGGHCGDCFYGFERESSEPNSHCRKQVEQSVTTIRTPVPVAYDVQVKTQGHESTAKFAFLFLGGLFVLGIFITIIAAKCVKSHRSKKRKNRTPKNLACVTESKSGLLISNGSCLGYENDLETDACTEQSLVRGENPTLVTLEAVLSGRERIPFAERRDLSHINLGRVIDRNDQTLITAADKIHGERRHELFQSYLKIDIAKTSPPEELWRSEKMSFNNYILDVLKVWVQKADKTATLKNLCEALYKADFVDIIDEILKLSENHLAAPEYHCDDRDNTDVKELNSAMNEVEEIEGKEEDQMEENEEKVEAERQEKEKGDDEEEEENNEETEEGGNDDQRMKSAFEYNPSQA